MSEERYYSYEEFCDYARRFDQVSLLTAIAETALAVSDKVRDPSFRRTPPWALAGLAKASICHGNPHRSGAVRSDSIGRACHMYNNLTSGEIDREELKTPFGILTRIAFEQFPYQESLYGELARAEAFFGGYSGRKKLEVLSGASLTQLLGAPLRQAVGVAFVLYAAAQVNSGFFDPTWMDQPQFSEVLAIVPQGQITSVINKVFVNDFDDFKRQAAEAPPLPFLDRYMFNPLTARPFLRLSDGRLLAPVPQLIGRKLSPMELYYLGNKRWGNPFTNDMGHLFEDYAGRQLQTLPGVTVHPEIKYRLGKNRVDSVDWIVIADDAVLLVEAKATRVPVAARAGEASTKDVFKRTLGKAFEQINRTHLAIRDGLPEFSAIPTDRPIFGLVTTLDHWYIANSGLARPLLVEPDVPTLVASVGALEHFVAIGQRRPASTILSEILGDERRTWDLTTALVAYTEASDYNPLLREAWETYPFREESGAPALEVSSQRQTTDLILQRQQP